MALFRTLSQTSCFLLRYFLWTLTNHSSHFLLLLALFFLILSKNRGSLSSYAFSPIPATSYTWPLSSIHLSSGLYHSCLWLVSVFFQHLRCQSSWEGSWTHHCRCVWWGTTAWLWMQWVLDIFFKVILCFFFLVFFMFCFYLYIYIYIYSLIISILYIFVIIYFKVIVHNVCLKNLPKK